MDFIDEPKNSDRYLDKDSGVYQDYITMVGDLKIHIVLLDIRYDFDRSLNDRLGVRQLEWLDQKFKEHKDANVTLIVSGIQVIPNRVFSAEAWGSRAKKDLFDLVNKYERGGVILMSGDVHYS